MSMTFTKLFSSITESSIWVADDHTRLVWITMLAMSDKHGRVWAAIPGLANRARVPVESVEKAIAAFLAPDPYSRTTVNDGRRIEAIDGGWRLLNHKKYRDIRDDENRRAQNAEAQERYRSKQTRLRKPEVSTSKPTGKPIADTEAEADTDTEGHILPLSEKISMEGELKRIGIELATMGQLSDYTKDSKPYKRRLELSGRAAILRSALGVVA